MSQVLQLKAGSVHTSHTSVEFSNQDVVIALLNVVYEETKITIHTGSWHKPAYLKHIADEKMANGNTPNRMSIHTTHITYEQMVGINSMLGDNIGLFQHNSAGKLEVREIAKAIFLGNVDKERNPTVTVDGEGVETSTPVLVGDNWEFINL